MPLYEIVLAVLAVWRVTHLLAEEDGPGRILARLRARLGPGLWGQLASCFYCLSLWIAAPVALLAASGWRGRVELWLAASGGAILLERATGARSAVPAVYVEDPYPREESDHVLRPPVVESPPLVP